MNGRECFGDARRRAATRLCALALLASIAALAGSGRASAQVGPLPPDPSAGNVSRSGPGALFDFSTRFLRRLGDEGSGSSTGAPLSNNPGGSGASFSMTQVNYRAWLEAYGLLSRTGSQDDFSGDRRATGGIVAGIGATVAPGVSLGVSVDQGRTKIDILDFPQSATLNLTQLGVNAAFESGPWTLALAGVYGFGRFESTREDLGTNTASYDARLYGTLAELSYLWAQGSTGIVPKAGGDFTRTETGSFTETGGPNAISGNAQAANRARLFAGAEIGRSWNSDGTLVDLSAYGRAVGIVWQDIDALQITSGGLATTLGGVTESRIGADAGATASMRLNALTRLYAGYDGRFRANYISHTGTLGVELRW